MSTIYIVTHGVYSDYCIDAVFDKRELADEFAALHGGYDPCVVEEWELNPIIYKLPPGVSYYSVTTDGDNTEVRKLSNHYEPDNTLSEEEVYTRGKLWHFSLYAKSKEHAVKIASERRAMLIVSGDTDTFHTRRKPYDPMAVDDE